MLDNIMVKYDFGYHEFESNKNYTILFDNEKCQIIVSYDELTSLGIINTSNEEIYDFLKTLHKKKVLIKYIGLSRVDGLGIFSINTISYQRNKKIESLGL